MLKHMLKKEKIKEMIDKLLTEIEEEEVGISLFTTHYRNQEELNFFKSPDKQRVMQIIERITADSNKHKKLLETLVGHLGKKMQEARE